MTKTTNGNCLCGQVQFAGRGAPKIDVCHCGQCRKWHGGPAMGIQFADGVAIMGGENSLSWYASSEWAERGFCNTCGSTLFYRLTHAPDDLYAQAGSFDLSEGQAIHEHIFADEKPDYYAFDSDAPRLTAAQTLARFQAEQDEQNQ